MTDIEKHALHVRQNIIKMVYAAQSGHPGGSLSGADLLTDLYFREMDINKDNVDTIERDRFVLSKGHASPLLYAVPVSYTHLDVYKRQEILCPSYITPNTL